MELRDASENHHVHSSIFVALPGGTGVLLDRQLNQPFGSTFGIGQLRRFPELGPKRFAAIARRGVRVTSGDGH